MRIDDFSEIWLVQFQHDQPCGEPPTPVSLEAKEYRGGRLLRFGQEELRRPAPPSPVSPETLFVAYDAAVALGCHLALGWPMPARILDLHAEFRCLTSGLDVPGGYDLAGALAHFGLRRRRPGCPGEAPGGHAAPPRPAAALLRGRYMAAVARMEAVGVPIDMESLARLREGWERIQDALIEQVDRHYGVFNGRKFNPRCWAAWLNRNGIPWPRLATGRLDLRLDTFRDMAVAYPAVRPMQELRATLSQMRLFRLAVGADGRIAARCGRSPRRPAGTSPAPPSSSSGRRRGCGASSSPGRAWPWPTSTTSSRSSASRRPCRATRP